MSEKRSINNNIEAGGFWVAWALVGLFSINFDDNEYDLYDLIYIALSKWIGI